jgi:hypothetical protein
MRLAGSRVLSAVEKCKETVFTSVIAILLRGILCKLVGFDTGQSGGQISLVKNMSLRLELSGGEDEVLRDNGKLVEHKVVGGTEMGDAESCRRICKGVKGLCGLGTLGRAFWLVRESGRKAKLELQEIMSWSAVYSQD